MKVIAKNRNTFAKRARETEKKRKAEEKRVNRKKRAELPPDQRNNDDAEAGDQEAEASDKED